MKDVQSVALLNHQKNYLKRIRLSSSRYHIYHVAYRFFYNLLKLHSLTCCDTVTTSLHKRNVKAGTD